MGRAGRLPPSSTAAVGGGWGGKAVAELRLVPKSEALGAGVGRSESWCFRQEALPMRFGISNNKL